MRHILVVVGVLLFSVAYAKENDEALILAVVPNEPGIGFGDIMSTKNMRIHKFKSSELPSDYVHPSEYKHYNGKTVKEFIPGGEPLRKSHIGEYPMQKEIDSLEKAQKEIKALILDLKGCLPRCEQKYIEGKKEIEL